MRKKSRAMDSEWALEIMHKAPYTTVSFIDEEGKHRDRGYRKDSWSPTNQ